MGLSQDHHQQQHPGFFAVVEAAEALTQLVSSRGGSQSRQPQTQSYSPKQCVSDEDESTTSPSRSPPQLLSCTKSKNKSKHHHHHHHRSRSQHQQLCPLQPREDKSQAFDTSVKQTATVTNPSLTSPAAASTNGNANSNKLEMFPLRLHRMLSDPSVSSNIITWLPHGRSFVVLRPDVFAERVIPCHFPESANPPNTGSSSASSKSTAAKYPSFTRKLNRWGFRQMNRGPDAGAFHHPYFRRDDPELSRKMECQKKAPRGMGGKRGGRRGAKKDIATTAKQSPTPVPALQHPLTVERGQEASQCNTAGTRPRVPLKKRKLSFPQPSDATPAVESSPPQKKSTSAEMKKRRIVVSELPLSLVGAPLSAAACAVTSDESSFSEMSSTSSSAVPPLSPSPPPVVPVLSVREAARQEQALIRLAALDALMENSRAAMQQQQWQLQMPLAQMPVFAAAQPRPQQGFVRTPSTQHQIQQCRAPIFAGAKSSGSNGAISAAYIRAAMMSTPAGTPQGRQHLLQGQGGQHVSENKAHQHRSMLYRAFLQAMSA